MFKLTKNKKILFFLTSLLILIPISIILAEPGWRMQTDWPRSPAGTELTEESEIHHLVAYLYEWGIALGGLVAFVALLIAGFLYLTSVGDPNKMKEAISRIKHALGGLVLLLSSWLILHTINPELTTLQEIRFRVEDMPKPEQLKEKALVEEGYPCLKARIFESPNFEGDYFDMDPMREGIGGRWIDPPPFQPRSYFFCRERKKIEIDPEDGTKVLEKRRPDDPCPDPERLINEGACTLQFYVEGAVWGVFGCGKVFSEIGDFNDPDLTRRLEFTQVGCIELIARGFEIELP